ncbi:MULTISPECIES: hypothetical protein [unclassified Delftia]|uniref:hypothetical protein n=1 Tax=unclassified Delftia TaxID=2613839 RepID=UPI0019001408|nr:MULTISPECIES: hypothetical protein [unclassified Delftia]MBK0111046.1 hypothetical protein [Delftia sp. S65]MBK0119479.1 hypothetical protein [Delftia sp. S67]MBK0130217.1 hypothetical protein [Delftia sp. S66]
MADSLIWGGHPTAPGWYAVVVDYGRLPFPAARRWTGALWDDERGIRAFDGPHDTAEAALDWAMERCPED